MGAGSGKNKVRRKKRISKHVQDAEDRRKAKAEGGEGEKAGEGQAQQQQNGTSSAKKKKRSANRHVKDPAEAASYLSSWKHRDAGSGWRFNKNTQSWLLRHMYETEKVPKPTFTLLVDYLVGCQGITRRRLREDAARRALRYKEYEKKSKSNDPNEKNATGGGDGDDVATKEAAPAQKKDTEDDGNDEAQWKALDDHDKRKEYKRARKILDTIKEEE